MADGQGIRGIVEGAPEEPERSDLDLARLPRNDMGNAERLVARRGQDLIHVDNQGWFHWDDPDGEGGTHWAAPLAKKAPVAMRMTMGVMSKIRDEAIALQREARSFAESMGAKPAKDDEPAFSEWQEQKRKLDKMEAAADSHFKFANSSGMVGKVKAAMELAEPDLRRRPEDLDRDAYLFNCPSGTLQLLTRDAMVEGHVAGEPLPLTLIAAERPHDRADLITKLGGVDFDPKADCPRFKAFLAKIQPKVGMQRYLQRVSGYCLTGDISEQVYFMFWGEGSNGKSTLVRIMRAVLGSYAVKVPIATFLHNEHRKGGDTTPELLLLPGARVAFAAEPPKNARLAEDVLKDISGGETMQARPLFQGMFEFNPQFKLIISFNPKPKLRDDSHGSWRRVQLVPFEVEIQEEEKDPHLVEAIIAEELPGILNWCLEGFCDWREGGLRPPYKVRAATEQYRMESDPIGEFLKLFTQKMPGMEIQSSRLFDTYVRWCIETTREPSNKTVFGNRVKTAFTKSKKSEMYWQDVGLNEAGVAMESRIVKTMHGAGGAGGSREGTGGSGGATGGSDGGGDPRETAGWMPKED